MIDERLETQASLYALDALPADELAAFEKELQSNAELRQLVAELREAADAVLLASPAVAPPAHLKQKILNRLESGGASRSNIVPLERPSRPSVSWMSWALAACLAVVCTISLLQQVKSSQATTDLQNRLAGLGRELGELSRENSQRGAQLVELVSQNKQAQAQLAAMTNRLQVMQSQSAQIAADFMATNQAAMDRIASLISSNRLALSLIAGLASTNSTLQAELAQARDMSQYRVATFATNDIDGLVVWNHHDQKGLLRIAKLPPLAAGQDYQLWVLEGKNPRSLVPVSAGVIALDAQGTAAYVFNPASSVEVPAAFAISLERKGGSTTGLPDKVIIASK